MATNKRRLLAIPTLILWALVSGQEAKAQKGNVRELINCINSCPTCPNSCSSLLKTLPCSIAHALCTARCWRAFDGIPEPSLAAPGANVPSVVDFETERTQPSCKILVPGPPMVKVGVQDTGSGLLSIRVVEAVNANVHIPSFTEFTREQVVITASRQDPDKPGRVLVAATNGCQIVKFCDPVMTSTVRTTGKPVTDSYANLPQEEGFVTISNGSPGVRTVQITVNGTRFKAVTLKDGEERTLNVSSAMLPGDANIITLRSTGQPGGSADVLIWDGGGWN
jgi:hypothetical protein